jgi:hypothetical protein
MVFGWSEVEDYQERYCTWEEAEAGHKKVLDLVRESIEYDRIEDEFKKKFSEP